MNWCILCIFGAFKEWFMCIVWTFHEFHANVVFPAIYSHLLPNRKYRKYRVIIVSKPKISCNIVWTLKKDIAEGWPEQGRGNGDEKAEAIAWNGEVNLVGTIVSFILTGHIRIVKGSFVSEKRNALRQPFLLQKLFAVGFPLTFLPTCTQVPLSLYDYPSFDSTLL